jgi:alpha/beta superfamily hydrolase
MAIGAVLLHPHPSYGGDQHNVVITALWRALGDAGARVVRFDFASADVDACVAQAVAAIDSLPPDAPVAMVGYSFGGIVASRVLDQRVAAWVLVAAPVLDGPIGGDPRPKLVLVPAHDQFLTPADARRALVDWQATTVEEVALADHFLHGVTGAVAARVVDWLSSPAGP